MRRKKRQEKTKVFKLKEANKRKDKKKCYTSVTKLRLR